MYIFKDLPYDILWSIIAKLDDEGLEMLSYTCKTIYTDIMTTPLWRNRVKCHGLMKSMFRYRIHRKVHMAMNIWCTNIDPYNNFHELFSHSLCIGGGLVKTYIPIFFVFEVSDANFNIRDTDVLMKEPDVRPFLNIQVEKNKMGKIFSLQGLPIWIQLQYLEVVDPLINLSETCVFGYNRLIPTEFSKIVTECSQPTLEFVFKYDNYIEVLKQITKKDS